MYPLLYCGWHLEVKYINVEEEAAAEKKALDAWLSRCKAEVGDVKKGAFKKILSALVYSYYNGSAQTPRISTPHSYLAHVYIYIYYI